MNKWATRIYLQTMNCVYDVSCVCKSWRPMAALHLSHVHPSFWWRVEHCPTEKSGTRMHGTRAKLLVPVSGTRNLGGDLGSCAMGLKECVHYSVCCIARTLYAVYVWVSVSLAVERRVDRITVSGIPQIRTDVSTLKYNYISVLTSCVAVCQRL